MSESIIVALISGGVTQIVALVMAGAGVIAYIIGEGLTDAAVALGLRHYIGIKGWQLFMHM